jgi:hypothetical protein
MFVAKAGAHPKVEHLKISTFQVLYSRVGSWLQVLHSRIGSWPPQTGKGLKSLPRTNTLACYKILSITGKKVL